jgi:hypothetical protein
MVMDVAGDWAVLICVNDALSVVCRLRTVDEDGATASFQAVSRDEGESFVAWLFAVVGVVEELGASRDAHRLSKLWSA